MPLSPSGLCAHISHLIRNTGESIFPSCAPMPSEQARAPKRPKLRSSCDGCGASKLKCDRGQPECGRCVSHGMTCVYGLSRKMGKPPREKLRPSSAPSPEEQQAGPAEVEKIESSNDSGMVLDFSTLPSVTDSSAAWDAMEDTASGLPITLDAPDRSGPSLSGFNSVSFGDWALTDPFNDNLLPASLQFGPMSTPDSPVLGSPAPTEAPTTHPTPLQTQSDMNLYPDRASMQLADFSDHDCPRKAHEILGSLSFLNVSKGHPVLSANTVQMPSANGLASQVPLDRVLQLNREACESLSRLLTCTCARSPSLALLYASIISRILIWYQQAAACTQNSTWNSAPIALEPPSYFVSSTRSSPGSTSGSGSGSPAWSSTATSTFGMGDDRCTATLTQSAAVAVAPAKMAIGTYNIDDLRVETALKIQLLLGELRRAGCLIDQFTSCTSGGQCLSDEAATFSGVDSLYRSLGSWLSGEHSSIATMMRLKLRELNT
jgi:hypothetical protein